MLNWIVWNKTISIKKDLALNNLQSLIYHKTQTNKQTENNKAAVLNKSNRMKKKVGGIFYHFFLTQSIYWLWVSI